MSDLLDLISYLGYEIETTDVPPNEQYDPLYPDYAVVDDGNPDITWIRSRKDNTCYQIESAMQDYLTFQIQKILQQSQQIKRPKEHYKVAEFFES